jgi:hypothetical protein
MSFPDPYPNDFIAGGRSRPADPYRELAPQGDEIRRWRDEWGVTWASLTEFDKGEVVAGPIEDWSDLDRWQPPDLGIGEQYAETAGRFAADSEHFRIGGLPGFTFNIARKLRKLENYLCDLMLEPDKVSELHDRVRAELLKGIDCLADAGADAIMFPEDWGTQDRLMISPALWRDLFRPEFETLCGRAHQRGLLVFMHSCGMITDIIDDLIECGVNVLQFDQPRLHGIETLSERFGGKVTFWCPVDIQRTLQTRDPDLIREEARLLVERLGGFDGGFLGGYYRGNEAIGLSPDVQEIAVKAFVEYGRYDRRPV